MKRLFFIICSVFLAFSCGREDSALVNLKVSGAGNKQMVLSKLQIDKVEVIDTLTTDASGSCRYKLAADKSAPEFYYISYNKRRLASLIVKGGDKIDVEVDTLGNNLVVTGSVESELLADIESEIHSAARRLDSLSVILTDAVEHAEKDLTESLKKEIASLYINHKRGAIKRIVTNPNSFANISVLYQRLLPDASLFSDPMDVVYFQRVKDSLSLLYPNSAYVRALDNDINALSNNLLLNDRIQKMSEVPFPDLILPDAQANSCKMSDMLGKPFILIFWTATNPQQKIFNQDLKELYNKYSATKGLNIYQVSVDVDKALWASVVKKQQLPWVNVCDGAGLNSTAVSTYNINRIPAMFIMNSNGDIVAKNIFDKRKLDAELSKLR